MPTEPKHPLKVFPSASSGHRLSHAHADATRVRALYDRLTADGVDSWLDKDAHPRSRLGTRNLYNCVENRYLGGIILSGDKNDKNLS